MKEKIIIIGAGFSGLYLAHLLEDKYEVVILEARNRIGGRIFSINNHDLGPSWIWSHQKNILDLVNSLGLELIPQYTKGYALYDTKEKVELFNAPPSAPSARIKGSLSKLITALKEKLTSTTIVLSEEVVSIEEEGKTLKVKSIKNKYEAKYLISTLPPRLCANLELTPQLPKGLKEKMKSTQTWMGNSAKCVIEFKTAFWKKKSLSGFAFSHVGPLGEIHDACTDTKAALFGFVNSNADMNNFEMILKQQLKRVFDIDESEIVNIFLVDWREEKFSSTKDDSKPLREHPSYGIDTSAYSRKILFSSTEFSFSEGGYLEGAIINAKKLLDNLNSY